MMMMVNTMSGSSTLVNIHVDHGMHPSFEVPHCNLAFGTGTMHAYRSMLYSHSLTMQCRLYN